MKPLIECIPNISEGRDQTKIKAIADAVESTPDVWLLDVDSDADHNRSVITFVGDDESIQAGLLNLFDKAVNEIDLKAHSGEHPRMGAVDVVPFVPIKNASMDDCVEISKNVAEQIWERFQVPVYLYEASATHPDRENLAKIRKGQFEGFGEKIQEENWAPDYGDREVHPSAGVVAVGARMPLIAYNVNLGTDNLEIATKIAHAVRHLSGGFRYVKALGFTLDDRGIVQVSMNMTNYEKSPLFRVFNLIKLEAERYGVPVLGSEIVGLVPRQALIDTADFHLQLEAFENRQILEEKIEQAMSSNANN